MKKPLLLLVAVSILISACTKDDNLPEGGTGGPKLHRVLTEGRVVQEYEYNPDGLVTRQSFYGPGTMKYGETIYIYDSSKKVIKTESSSNVSSSSMFPNMIYAYAEYSYGPDGRVSETRTFSRNGSVYELTSRIVPTYDAQGRVISTLQSSVDNKPANLYKYEYNQKGNIVSQESYRYEGATQILGFRTTYEHDDKNNPYINLLVLPFSVNKNNITKHTTTNYNLTPGVPVVTTALTVYKRYNNNGFPVEVFEEGAGTFIYEYR